MYQHKFIFLSKKPLLFVMIFERGVDHLFEYLSAKIKQHIISAAPAVRDDKCGMSHPNAIQCGV
jgi:hypothetical protein